MSAQNLDDSQIEPSPRRRRKFSLRGFTSLMTAWGFLLLSITGVVLFVTPRGRDARWTNWTLAGLDKEQWGALHVSLSILFLVFAVIHLLINWRVFWNYLKKKATPGLNLRRELALATAAITIVVVGSIYGVPPFSTVMGYHMEIKDYWSREAADQASRAPVAHAEDLTLAQFATELGLPIADVTDSLQQEGYKFADDSVKVADVAESRGVSPQEVLMALRKHYPAAAGGRGAGRGPGGRGQGGGQGCSETEEHGPGGGPGRGMGRGMGLGPGAGRGGGMGMGLGRGWMQQSSTVTDETQAQGCDRAAESGVPETREHDEPLDDNREDHKASSNKETDR